MEFVAFSFRPSYFFDNESKEVAIVRGQDGKRLKIWDNFEEAVMEIKKLGNIRVDGGFWISKNVRVSFRVLKGLYNELISANWEREIIRQCESIGVTSVTIYVLGDRSVLRDQVLVRGLKGGKHFCTTARSFIELLLKLEKIERGGGAA